MACRCVPGGADQGRAGGSGRHARAGHEPAWAARPLDAHDTSNPPGQPHGAPGPLGGSQGGGADRRRGRARVRVRPAGRRDPLAEAELHEALDQLVAAELVFIRGTPPTSTYTFKHALVQDAAYASPRRRGQLHANIARELEGRWPEVREDRPGLRAWADEFVALTAEHTLAHFLQWARIW